MSIGEFTHTPYKMHLDSTSVTYKYMIYIRLNTYTLHALIHTSGDFENSRTITNEPMEETLDLHAQNCIHSYI